MREAIREAIRSSFQRMQLSLLPAITSGRIQIFRVLEKSEEAQNAAKHNTERQ
jgi:hypothetical protein